MRQKDVDWKLWKKQSRNEFAEKARDENETGNLRQEESRLKCWKDEKRNKWRHATVYVMLENWYNFRLLLSF